MAVTLEDIIGVGDLLSSDRFLVAFPKIPGGGDHNGLMLKCTRCAIPATGHESGKIELYGFSRPYRGRKKGENVVEMTFVEDARLGTLSSLAAWLSMVIDPVNASFSGRASAAVTTSLYVLDPVGRNAAEFVFVNLMMEGIGDIEFSDDQAVVNIPASFTFDYIENTFPFSKLDTGLLSKIKSGILNTAATSLSHSILGELGQYGLGTRSIDPIRGALKSATSSLSRLFR
jgi:hypothetical protein